MSIYKDFKDFLKFLWRYSRARFYVLFAHLEKGKDNYLVLIIHDQGKLSRPLQHVFVLVTIVFLVLVGPRLFHPLQEPYIIQQSVLATDFENVSMYTLQAEEVRLLRGGEVIEHEVKESETLTAIAEQYGLQDNTVRWENNLKDKEEPKVGQILRILPTDGIRHKVAKGETIESIGKKYGLEGAATQAIVDYPFNSFINDETFELATGQWLMVPGGTKPQPVPTSTPAPKSYTAYGTITPDAGTVSGTGSFAWPAEGYISQGYYAYHKAIDIARGGVVLASDSGTVVALGWDNTGYGNRIIIDHGNGYQTLYAHLASFNVVAGQSVNRGDQIGVKGSTGRSTGVHLHFEIRRDGVLLNPLNFLP